MPLIVGHWKMDNFFERPSSAKLPNSLHDCYFYYYSTCSKGNNCEYRHEPIALGHEQMCPKWIDGLCYDVKCKDRHMFIKKNRSRIPCFFENQPNGCNKVHCVFKHTRKDFDKIDEKNDEKINNDDIISELPIMSAHGNDEGIEDISIGTNNASN